MSFLSDIGSILGDFKDLKEEVTSTVKGVSDDVKDLKDQAAEPIKQVRQETAQLQQAAKQLGSELQSNLSLDVNDSTDKQ